MEERGADSEPTGEASTETPAECMPETPAEDASAPEEEEDFSWPEHTSQTLVIGCTLTAISGVVTICSLLSTVQLFYLNSVEKMFGYNNYYLNLKFSPMTAAFLVITIWWTAFSVAVTVVNGKLLNAVLKGEYEEIRGFSLRNSVMNGIGTNAALLAAFMVFFSDRYSALAPCFGTVLVLAAILQGALAVALFIHSRHLGLLSAEPVPQKKQSFRRRARPMDQLSKIITRHRNTFTLA